MSTRGENNDVTARGIAVRHVASHRHSDNLVFATSYMSRAGVIVICARCSLEGWGTFSEDASRDFVATFVSRMERDVDIGSMHASAKGNALLSFEEVVNARSPEYPEWATAEYAVCVIGNGSAFISWSGDIQAAIFNQGVLLAESIPHKTTMLRDGTASCVLTKCLDVTSQHDAEELSQSIGPFPVLSECVLACGTTDMRMSEFARSDAFQKIIRPIDTRDFLAGCDDLQRAISQAGTDSGQYIAWHFVHVNSLG